MSNLKNQVAIVTGGGSGIGLAIARAALSEGMRVIIAGRSSEKLDRAIEEIKAGLPNDREIIALPTDVSVASHVTSMVRQTADLWGRIDLLVNNAGIGQWGAIEALSEADWDRIQAINLKGAFLCIQAVLPVMKRQRSGYVVNISSLAGKMGMAGAAAYSASKFGMIGLTESLLSEGAAHHIRATAICPGYVATPMVAEASVPPEEMIPAEDIGKLVVGLLHLSPVTVIKEVVVQRIGAID
ncbi:MAG: SDR family NAD(P)-dependent oxidoreductase [Candidatus Manganitrophaceae bacterium]